MVPMELLNDDGEDLIYEVPGDAERGNPLDIVTVLTCLDVEAFDGVKFDGRETAKVMKMVWNAHVLAIQSDDDHPADFDWLTTQCQKFDSTVNEHDGVWLENDDGKAWWGNGVISFSCQTVQFDPGEPHKTVATEWMIDGSFLPKRLVPTTRGDFRSLCKLANR